MGRHYKILLVDDEERVLRALNSIFRRNPDFDIFLCTSPEEALPLLSRYSIDIIICDQRMPGVNGDVLLELVRQKFPNVIRLLLTASFDKKRLQQSIERQEFFGYISKPWNINTLNALVTKATRAADLQQNKQQTKEANLKANKNTGKNKPAKHLNIQKSVSTTTHSPASSKVKNIQKKSISLIPAPRDLSQSFTNRNPSNLASNKNLSLVLFDKHERVRKSVRKVSAHLKITVYVVNSFEQTVRILALRPDIGLVMFGIAEDKKRTDMALRVLKRYRDDLTVIALANTSNISQAVNLANNGLIYRYVHRLADLKSYHKALFYASKYRQAIEQQLLQQKQSLQNPFLLDSPRSQAQSLLAKANKTIQLRTKTNKPLISSHRGTFDQSEKASVVLIEMDQDVRNSVRSISRELGFNVYGVSSYEQARATLKIRPDVGVVLVGISSGLQNVKSELLAIKDQHKNIAIIALSDNQKAVLSMVQSGIIFRQLQKPLDIFAYERAMQAAIKHTQMQDRMATLKQQSVKQQSEKEQELSLIKETA
jgi:DNA-binding NtrC family response regulator